MASWHTSLRARNDRMSSANGDDLKSQCMEDGCGKLEPQQYQQTSLESVSLIVKCAAIPGASMWALFVIVIDPPFAAYWMLANACVLLAAYTSCNDTNDRECNKNKTPSKRTVCVLTVLTLIANLFVLIWLRKFEITDLAHYDPPDVPINTQADVQFFQIYNSQLSYMDDVETIHSHVNNQTSSTQRYEVDVQINAWSSDVLRYKFLLQYWQQIDEDQTHEPNNQIKVACLVESDVVFHEGYFADILRERSPLEIAHVQHFWGHQTLESFNIGILCTSSHASRVTRLWAWLMQALHAKRYRRLLYLDFLYGLVPNRLIFYWDKHHGCTEYYPHCRYIHFTRPKGVGIENAKEAIKHMTPTASLGG